MTLETTVFDFKISKSFQEWAAVYDSDENKAKSLYVRGTFYQSDGTKKRIEVPLSLEAHDSNIQLIRDRIHDFARIYRKLNRLPETFPWQHPEVRDQPTFADAIAAL